MPWTKVSLDKNLLGQLSLGQLSPWTIIPWTNVATPSTSNILSTQTALSPIIDFKISYISCLKPLKYHIFYYFSNPLFWLRLTLNIADMTGMNDIFK